ncbi:hypothetical protein DCS_05279 [Drechmeria coniospora]|uniref:Uncharacterized protein n=1 Tax=Drechmeria coniospora TaxID=98403 RepID=A0A151GME0_DRECN|nr:hypothetical protein DCS_05279 [Drechmeria coniospora]KYK58266.1 hypothetical protein DCS_05279 [Drechmeria coniospora]
MENEPSYGRDEGRSSRRGRFMGRLFGTKDKKPHASENSTQDSLDAFLHSSTDKLDITHPPPPPLPRLAKLDTTISRYPQALAVNQQAQSNRPLALGKHESKSPKRSPRPNKKGLVVRFADSYPEIIGEGGDESEVPVIDIMKGKRHSRPPQPLSERRPLEPSGRPQGAPELGPVESADDFVPKPLARSQTGYSSIYEPEEETDGAPQSRRDLETMLVPGKSLSARFLGRVDGRDDKRKSFIDIHQAQMRAAEGKAFAQAARSANGAPSRPWNEADRPSAASMVDSAVSRAQYPPSPDAHGRRQAAAAAAEYSPAGSIESTPPNSAHPQPSPLQLNFDRRPSPAAPVPADLLPLPHAPFVARMASVKLNDTVGANEALATFVVRTKHLFELFRLHAESVKPLPTCAPRDCARAGLWWFIRGRMGLESAIRDRPGSPRSQMRNDRDKQQAYANLAKGYWLCEEAIPEIAAQSRRREADQEIMGVRQGLISALTKLAVSMKKNGFLPPEEPFLPQTIDKSIWIDYPTLSHDLVALLSGNWGSTLAAMQQSTSTMQLPDALPLADTSEYFCYARVLADAFLTEQGRDSHRILLPCIVSVIRPRKKTGIVFVVASQDGSVQFAIQDSKKAGPSWGDVHWRQETCSMDVRLPRGFVLSLQPGQADYKTIGSMYEFGAKMQATLEPRGDEQVMFRSNLRSFQYIEAEPATGAFPKEPVLDCEVAVFEKIHKENGPAGPRNWHRGCRIAVVTGPRTRTVNGVHHTFLPSFPVRFGLFRSEDDAPALSVRYLSDRQKGRMVLMFVNEQERAQVHALLTGTTLDHGEKTFADVPVKSFMISERIREPLGISPFSRMGWKAAKVINDEFGTGATGGDQPPTVLSDKLKVVLEYQDGAVADRINVAPGELRMRLEVSNAKLLRVLRQPQQDMTVSASEVKVPKEMARNLSDALQLLMAKQTIRTYEFNSLHDLHSFQEALTGFEVIFDSLAVTFGITRRRMVVPIHKKWEAGYTRIQVVRLEDKQLQLLAFFEEFQHGHCMNFLLKGTDVYESVHRGGRTGIKFVDAKFPLPRTPADKDDDSDEMAFVCLDLPDLPGEHDDITIMFENEADVERALLTRCQTETD